MQARTRSRLKPSASFSSRTCDMVHQAHRANRRRSLTSPDELFRIPFYLTGHVLIHRACLVKSNPFECRFIATYCSPTHPIMSAAVHASITGLQHVDRPAVAARTAPCRRAQLRIRRSSAVRAERSASAGHLALLNQHSSSLGSHLPSPSSTPPSRTPPLTAPLVLQILTRARRKCEGCWIATGAS